MKDEKKTKAELIKELAALRAKVLELESWAPPRESTTGGLPKSRNLIARVLDGMCERLVVIGRDYKILEANRSFVERYGGGREKIVGRLCYDVTRRGAEPCDDAGRPCPVVTVYETAGPLRAVYTYKDSDGEEAVLEISAFPLLNADGGVDSVVVLTDAAAERKSAELKLKLNEERYELAQRAADIGIWDWDVPTGRLYRSTHIEPLFGFDPGEFGGTYEAFLATVHADDREYVVNSVNAGLEGGKEFAFEHRIVRPDGTVRWLSEKADVVRGAGGNPSRVLGVVRDITARKQAEEEIKYFNEFIGNIIESTQVGIYALDRDGTVQVWNQGMEKQFGLDSKEVVGKNIFDAFPVLVEEPLGVAIKKALEEGVAYEHAGFRHRTLRRGERILNTKINPLTNASGAIVGAVVITEDVTERVEASEALCESEERYRSLVEAIHGGFAIVDADENILFVNRAYCDMLGFTKDELIGMNMRELVTEDEFLKMKGATERKTRSKEPTKYEVIMRRKDGDQRQFLVSSTPFFDDRGNYKYTLGVALDITDQKNTEAELKLKTRQLEEAHRRADELLRNILPEQVIKELDEIDTSLPRSVPSVTIVFIDIAGFSNISARVSHKALVTKLAAYFHAFDLIVKDNGLEKLKTVGDGYMYAGGLFAENNQVEECARAALDILKIVGKRDWQVRIGIHVGPCIAGLVKGWRMIYDVWGDTVNVASRIQEACEPGRINVSQAVYGELADRFEFEYRGELPLYTVGPTPMYFLKRRKGR